MKFSIIITCFNREKFISRCIRSALHQSGIERSSYEVIVVDDMSKDNSRKIIEDIELDYNNRNNIEFTSKSENEFVMNMPNQENTEKIDAYKNKLFLDVLSDIPKNFSSIIFYCLYL